MNQSNAIFFFMSAAFFMFVTMRGELPKYMGFLLASPKTMGDGAGAGGITSPLGATSYNPANNASSTVSQDIGNAAVTTAKVVAAF